MADYTLPQAKKVEGLHQTAIEWTDYSANPLRAVTRDGKAGWACQKVATGCMHCYAEAVNIRFGTGLPFTPAGMRDVRVVLDEARVAAALTAKPRGPFRAPDGRPKVFVCDMTDLFGEWVPFDEIDRLFALFALRPDIDWQILTKRPERMAEYLGENDGLTTPLRVREAAMDYRRRRDLNLCWTLESWPLPNVWLGTSGATQADLDRNVPQLMRCPAAVRFLSLEPLVERVDLSRWFVPMAGRDIDIDGEAWRGGNQWDLLHQVIVGGESGPRARPCDLAWIRSVVRQCADAVVPCFVKQLGSQPCNLPTHVGDGSGRAGLLHPKGGEPSDWPEDLRVRQWPERKEADLG